MEHKYKDSVSLYAYDVIEGIEVAGDLAKKTCERHLRDMDRIGNKDFPFVFDTEEVDFLLDFSRMLKHTSGPLSGTQFEPNPFQIFILGSIFGWRHKGNRKIRRFRKAYIQLARKNAKSFLIAIICLYDFVLSGEWNFLGVIAATKRDQAKIIFNMIVDMAKTNPDLTKLLKFRQNVVYNPILGTDAKIIPLGKDSKTEDGWSAALGMVDEYHSHPDDSMLNTIASSQGQRLSPLICIITTAGFDLNAPCYTQEYTYCCSLLSGVMENETYFTYIAQMDKDDDINDEANWVKANPLLARLEYGIKHLREEWKLAQDIPEKKRAVLTKNMNIWVDAKDNSYIPLSKWNDCEAEMPDLTGHDCFVGVDLSKRIDLTSVGFEFVLEDGTYYVLQHSFIPEDVLQTKISSDRVPYDLWAQQGHATIVPGSVIDTDFVKEYIIRTLTENKWNALEIPYDPWSAMQFSIDMMNEGYEMVELRQGLKSLSEPTKNFRENVYQKKVKHNGDPLLRFAVSNAITRADAQSNIMLDKEKSRQRIDPLAAIMNAHARAMYGNNEVDLNEHIMSEDFSL